MGIFDIFSKNKEEKLDQGLSKTRSTFFGRLGKAIVGKSTVDTEVLDNLEEALVSSDVGVETTIRIIERIEKRVAQDKYVGTDELNLILKEEIAALLHENEAGSTNNYALSDMQSHT